MTYLIDSLHTRIRRWSLSKLAIGRATNQTSSTTRTRLSQTQLNERGFNHARPRLIRLTRAITAASQYSPSTNTHSRIDLTTATSHRMTAWLATARLARIRPLIESQSEQVRFNKMLTVMRASEEYRQRKGWGARWSNEEKRRGSRLTVISRASVKQTLNKLTQTLCQASRVHSSTFPEL